jgi:hypothetical protein
VEREREKQEKEVEGRGQRHTSERKAPSPSGSETGATSKNLNCHCVALSRVAALAAGAAAATTYRSHGHSASVAARSIVQRTAEGAGGLSSQRARYWRRRQRQGSLGHSCCQTWRAGCAFFCLRPLPFHPPLPSLLSLIHHRTSIADPSHFLPAITLHALFASTVHSLDTHPRPSTRLAPDPRLVSLFAPSLSHRAPRRHPLDYYLRHHV